MVRHGPLREAPTGTANALGIPRAMQEGKEDAYKLDDVRPALRRGDLRGASRLSRVSSLTPVST